MPGVCGGEVCDPGQGGHQQQDAAADRDLHNTFHNLHT